MTLSQITYKIRVKLCKLFFRDILNDFRECDIELGKAYGYDEGYATCLEEHNLTK